ncbi:hypothetical protein [Rhodoferax mekongensis]|uniref:hypothetical protein n=1 Tax=Rhodoferax mekongensis TaxID=3068341 RepID=UPI0028BEB67E|nr:hypothetical protein [Rhodoferax sp. TBRC 17199]MDT7515389.1 hypothetical protein [Rhodoferax sp. TBRC 17199]
MANEVDARDGEMSAISLLMTSYMQAIDEPTTAKLMFNIYINLRSEISQDKDNQRSNEFIVARNSTLGAYLDFLRSQLRP